MRSSDPGRPVSIDLNESQRKTLAACIGRSYPSWRIWQAHRTWYATGRPRADAPVRTLHAPDAGALCEQLAEVERQKLNAVPAPPVPHEEVCRAGDAP
ncbi:hypothetical protein GCM10010156_52900 [Planobispora rosea]|uniref:Uncharacterized protein n=1 Tax=Planobispora rosea TaxID=35762 RepID=A0A8J3S2T7_PLARO|nr:hypothetical protein GCM10010156_52900 [Planobispora rosea]GIH86692.1 hypothetical protein Pro02_51000 [Planobispora rosea]